MNALKKTVLITFVIWFACTPDEGLTLVSGVEGFLYFDGTWPDTVTAAATLFLDHYDLDSIPDHLIGYGDPTIGAVDSCYYFVQLDTGTYYQINVGLINVVPGFFVANLDSFLTVPEVPLEPLDDMMTLIFLKNNPIYVKPDSITRSDKEIHF